MLIVSLRGVNFGFWFHSGCSGQNILYVTIKVSFRVAREDIIYFVSSFYLLNSCNQSFL